MALKSEIKKTINAHSNYKAVSVDSISIEEADMLSYEVRGYKYMVITVCVKRKKKGVKK